MLLSSFVKFRLQHLTALLFLVCLTAYGQNCSEVETGKFETFNESGAATHIKRTRRSQIEVSTDISSSKKIKRKYEVIWTDDCKYQLKYSTESGHVYFLYEIIEVGEDYYIAKKSSPGKSVEEIRFEFH